MALPALQSPPFLCAQNSSGKVTSEPQPGTEVPIKWRRSCQEQVRSQKSQGVQKWQCPEAWLFLTGTSQRLCGSL